MSGNLNFRIEKDSHYGPHIIRVGGEPFGFADYQDALGRPFTLLHLGPAGHFHSPFSATASLLTSIALAALLIFVGLWGWRRRWRT